MARSCSRASLAEMPFSTGLFLLGVLDPSEESEPVSRAGNACQVWRRGGRRVGFPGAEPGIVGAAELGGYRGEYVLVLIGSYWFLLSFPLVTLGTPLGRGSDE